MPNVLIKYKYKIKKEPVKKEFNWYDSDYKKLHTFECSRLEYKNVYDPNLDKYRLIAQPVTDAYEEVKSFNKECISEWIREYLNYNDAVIDIIQEQPEGILVNIDNNSLEDALYDLERQDFTTKLL